MDRRKTRDVLFYALNCAISDRLAFIYAYGDDRTEPAVRDAHKDIAAFARLKKRLYGDARSSFEARLDELNALPLVSIYEIRKMIDTPNP